MEDILLTEFFKKERWEAAIETAVEKDISQQLLREMSTPDNKSVQGIQQRSMHPCLQSMGRKGPDFAY